MVIKSEATCLSLFSQIKHPPSIPTIQSEWDQFLAEDTTRRYRIRPLSDPVNPQEPLKLTYHPRKPPMSRQQHRKQLKNMRRLYLWDQIQRVWLKRKADGYVIVVDEGDILPKIRSAWEAHPQCGNAVYDRLKSKYAGIPQRHCLKAVELLKRLSHKDAHLCSDFFSWRDVKGDADTTDEEVEAYGSSAEGVGQTEEDVELVTGRMNVMGVRPRDGLCL